MDKLIDILAAFDAGKLPSHHQVVNFLEWLKKDIISDGAFSTQGRIVVQRLRDVATAYQLLGEHKNKDNLLQEAIWHLSQGDISDTSVDVDIKPNTDEAVKDAQDARESIRTILSIIWSGLSSESSSLFEDFTSFARLSLADAAEVVEKQASRAKGSLREVDEEVQSGKRDMLGRDKERLKQEEDIQVAFEHGMDTVKGAGSSVIGAGQQSVAKASDLSDRTSAKLHNAFYKMCERAQNDEEYHQSLDTLFGTVQKWISKGFNSATNVASSLDSLVDDNTTDKHITKALQAIEKLSSRLAHTDSLSKLVSAIRKCAVDIRDDQDLRSWFDDFFTHLRRDLDESGYIRSDESKRVRKDLRTRWKDMLDQDSEFGRTWKNDVEAMKGQIHKIQNGLKSDEDLNRLRDAHLKLGEAIETGLIEVGDQAQTGMQAIVEQLTWFWQDLFRVYLPRALSMMKDIPIPRTEYKDAESELVLENLDVSSFNLLPSHMYIRNITDIDIVAPASAPDAPVQPESKTQLGTLTQIRIQAIQLAVSDISFYYKDKTATIGPAEYTGRMSLTLPPKGIDVDVKMPPFATATKTVSQRSLHRAFHVIEHLDVRITDEFELDIKDSNHGVMIAMFKPIMALRLKSALEGFVSEHFRQIFEGLDGLAYDISERAEIFKDTGLGSSASIGAAVWSEVGRMRRLGLDSRRRGQYTDWQATGTGVVVAERQVDLETGEDKERERKFAMGAEPQILSGEKKGPDGTASESLSKRLRSATGQALDDTGVNISEQAKEIFEDGKNQVKNFKDAVKHKSDVEKHREGWQSSAFDFMV
ncbi:hypothetical protein EV359DRAFT_33186 [Lentinula novae-zelandiae]|nr:hypothetical protein EV359DRAFT_33186 [Lentinula novae-zelandiae]